MYRYIDNIVYVLAIELVRRTDVIVFIFKSN